MENWDLFTRKLQGKLSQEEELLFEKQMESSENRRFFEGLKHLRDQKKGEKEFQNLNVDRAWEKVLKKYDEQIVVEKKKVFNLDWMRYAAVFMLILIGGYFLWDNTREVEPKNKLVSETITLINSKGEAQVIQPGASLQLKDDNGNVTVAQQGNQLVYGDGEDEGEMVYNELIVPYGKKFQVSLADGTLVHLNAGSSLKYPVRFAKNQKREVTLTGEAFFEVTEDKDRPFLVETGSVNIRVFGTKFNVSSYPEDTEVSTVLVEGSVGLYDGRESYKEESVTFLSPGFKGDWDKKESQIDLEKVDVEIYTGWTEGRLVLKNLPFSAIIPKLERHYNVSLVNSYAYLNDQVFTASFDIESIEQVLDSFKEDTPFKYAIKDNLIIIKKP